MTHLRAGDLDPEFGNDGIKPLEPHGDFYKCHSLSASGEGLFVAGGNQGPSGTYTNFVLIKLDQQGERVKEFASNGVAEGRFTSDASLSSLGLKVFTLDNSNILLLGQFTNGTGAHLPGTALFSATGQLDLSYGTLGTHVVHTSLIPEYGGIGGTVIDGCRQADDALVTINTHTAPDRTTTLIVKTNPNGTPANEFNDGLGYVDAEQRGGEVTLLNAVATDEKDAILVCGSTTDVRNIKTGIIRRLDPNGRDDNSFANKGELRSTAWNFDFLQVCSDRIICCGSTTSDEALILQLDPYGNPLHAPSITPAGVSTRWIKTA
ncbi:hypothetical protein ACOI9X_03400 [Pseudomonas sp. P2757]